MAFSNHFSKKQTFLTRRQALLGLTAVPLLTSTKLNAASNFLGISTTDFHRMKLGSFEITTLLAGTRTVKEPQKIFGLNVSAEEFAAASKAAHIPVDSSRFYFTPTVVNTGTELVLFDTGLSSDGISGALKQAGYSNDQIDVVVITHMHGDHIGGLMNGENPTFPNARYVTGAVEFDSWAKTENKGFEGKVRPLAEKMTMVKDGQSVVSGITATEAFGHTPGHMVYRIESDGQQLIVAADFANHYVWSLAYPDWEVKFDMDKAQAAKTRRHLLDMMAADKIPFIGYHMPFPGVGYVSAHNNAYQYEAMTYQLLLE